MQKRKRITDKERMDWLLEGSNPTYAQREGIVGYWAGTGKRFWGRESWTYRQAIDAAIRAERGRGK